MRVFAPTSFPWTIRVGNNFSILVDIECSYATLAFVMETSPVIHSKPQTWVKFKPSLCESCWASCCHKMPVQVSVRDLTRLGLIGEEEASTSLQSAARRLVREGILKPLRRDALIFVLRQRRNGDCIFLGKDRRCTVYRNRPEICRKFPKIGPKPGYCPYRRK